MYQNLLVPVGEGLQTEKAIEGAIQLAKQMGASITGLLIEPDIAFSESQHHAEVLAFDFKRIRGNEPAVTRPLLESFGIRAETVGVPFSGHIVKAYQAAPVIVLKATELGCDAIVMVKRRYRSPVELLVGTTLQKVTNKSSVPIFLLC